MKNSQITNSSIVCEKTFMIQLIAYMGIMGERKIHELSLRERETFTDFNDCNILKTLHLRMLIFSKKLVITKMETSLDLGELHMCVGFIFTKMCGLLCWESFWL